MSTIDPASGATAGVLPRDLAIEEWVSLRRLAPWPPEWSPYGRGDLSGPESISASELYKRYRADCEAGERKPLSQPQFGEAMQAIPGITRWREAGGYLYSGLTIETRAERVYATVHWPLFNRELDARGDEPWAQRREAHRLKHVHAYMATRRDADWDCTHDQPPDVVAGLAEVEAAIATDVAAAVERYREYTGAAPVPEPTGPSIFAGMPDEDAFADY